MVDRGFDSRFGQIKDYKIDIGTCRKRIKSKTSCLVVRIIPSLHGIGIMKFFMKISYLAPVQCMTQVSKCYP